jgi:hypothetical protein
MNDRATTTQIICGTACRSRYQHTIALHCSQVNVVHVDVKSNHKLSISSCYAYLIQGMTNCRLYLLTTLTVKENFLVTLTTNCFITPDLALESGSIVDLNKVRYLVLSRQEGCAIEDLFVLRYIEVAEVTERAHTESYNFWQHRRQTAHKKDS